MKFASVRPPSKPGPGRGAPGTTAPRLAAPGTTAPGPRPPGAPPPAEPTPWATGLTAAAMVAALAMAADLLVSQALRGAYGWLWIPANLMLAVGIGPALWLMRKTPFWRWITYGVVVGFGLAWVGLGISVVFRARTGG